MSVSACGFRIRMEIKLKTYTRNQVKHIKLLFVCFSFLLCYFFFCLYLCIEISHNDSRINNNYVGGMIKNSKCRSSLSVFDIILSV